MSEKNTIPNRQAVCETLMRLAKDDSRIVVLASDSRGSAAMAPFAQMFPDRFVEIGIAEQNLVGVAAGLAASGMQPFVTSPACFLSMRSIEPIKVDVAYSGTNVVLVGISGGVSYGALGMSHHSVQDLAVMRAIPGISVFLPADRFETEWPHRRPGCPSACGGGIHRLSDQGCVGTDGDGSRNRMRSLARGWGADPGCVPDAVPSGHAGHGRHLFRP